MRKMKEVVLHVLYNFKMNEFISAFSFYGILRIIIPGLYFFLCGCDFFLKINKIINLFESEILNTFAFGILIIVLGLLVYSIDFPRIIRKLTPELPTSKVKAINPNIDISAIEKNYFQFYYSLPIELIDKTERYNGFFHLSINLGLVSSFYLIVTFIITYWISFNSFTVYNILIFLATTIISFLLYNFRLKKVFQNDLTKYYNSKEYEKLLEIKP